MDKPRVALLLTILCLLPSTLLAQNYRPLKCGTDLEGGIPYIFGDKKNPIGFEVELMDALAKELGRPIEREHADFETLLTTLNRGDVDCAMNGLEISPANLQHAQFTKPYYIYQLQLIARIDGKEEFTTLEECKERKLTVGAITNSAAANLLKEKGVMFRGYPDQEGPFKDLLQDQVQAVLVDVPIAIYYVVRDKEIEHRKRDYPGLKLVGPAFAEGYYGIAVRRGDVALRKELDSALERVIESGELKRILTKWHLWSPEQYRLYPDRIEEAAEADAAPANRLPFWEMLTLLLQGAAVTVEITVAGMALAVVLGLLIATARLYAPWPVRWLAVGYVEFFRGIPVLLLIYFIYFGLPDLFPKDVINLKLDPLVAAIIGFGLNYAAYEAEIYRNGIQAVPLGQWEAAASLGMSPLLTFRRIIFPQSIRVILPPMTNDFIALFKDTSVVSVISVIELSKQYQILTKSYSGVLEIGLTTAALYLVMSVPLGYLSRYLEKRWGTK